MNNEHLHSDDDRTRSINDMDCLSVCVLLKYAICSQRLIELLTPRICDCCKFKLENPAFRLQMAHSACHHSMEFALIITEELDFTHSSIMSKVEDMDLKQIFKDYIPKYDTGHRQHIGLAWALLRSVDVEKQNVGATIIHMIFYNDNQTDISEHNEYQHVNLKSRCETLERTVKQKQKEIDDMLDFIYRTRSVSKNMIAETVK